MTACAECEASLYPNVARFVEHGPSRDLCRDCQWPAERVYAQLGLKVHRYGEWLTSDDRAEARRIATTLPRDQIEGFTLDGLAIGEHAHAGALRFFATGSLDDEPHARGRAAPLSRVRAADDVRDPAPDQGRRVLVGGLHARHLRAVGPGRRGRAAGARQGLDLERRLPQAALHLQPRRHLSPHADERADVSVGGPRAHGRAGRRSDEVPREPPRGHVRLDRVPSTDDAEHAGHRRGRSGSIATVR